MDLPVHTSTAPPPRRRLGGPWICALFGLVSLCVFGLLAAGAPLAHADPAGYAVPEAVKLAVGVLAAVFWLSLRLGRALTGAPASSSI